MKNFEFTFEPNYLEQLRKDGPPAGSCGEVVAGFLKPAAGLVWFVSDKKTFLVSVKSLKPIKQQGGKNEH